MKKLFLVLACFLSLLPLTVGAAYETSGDYWYEQQSDGTVMITSYSGQAKDVVIPSKLGGRAVTAIGESAFEERNLASVTIPNGVTTIGDYAFMFCSNLTRVSLPDSVTSIGVCAFACCPNLASISIPNHVVSIDNDAFYGCFNLSSISIPNSVSYLGRNPFARCPSLTAIVIRDSHPALATIDGVLFSKREKRLIWYPMSRSASSYIIPQGIREIGESAFSECSNLKTITIPDSVHSIGSSAFYSCSNLSSVSIPDSVSYIGYGAFENCDFLTLIVAPGSYALQYARENAIPYKTVDSTHTTSTDWLNQ